MSGGYFSGDEYKIKLYCDDISREHEIKKDLPEFTNLLSSIGNVLYEIITEYDYHISGDAIIENIKSFEKESIEKLNSILKEIK